MRQSEDSGALLRFQSQKRARAFSFLSNLALTPAPRLQAVARPCAILRASKQLQVSAKKTATPGPEFHERMMNPFLLEYLPILIFTATPLILGTLLLGMPFVLAPTNPDTKKLSAYECGFPVFDDARMKFNRKSTLLNSSHAR